MTIQIRDQSFTSVEIEKILRDKVEMEIRNLMEYGIMLPEVHAALVAQVERERENRADGTKNGNH